jgi:hypothetical protein
VPFVPVTFPSFLNVSAALVVPQVPLLTPFLSNLDGAGLKLEWDITKTRGSDPDQGTVKIYNLSTAYRGLLASTWSLLDALGTPLLASLSIGWDRIVGQVALSQVWKVTAEERVGEDVVTTLFLGDGGVAIRDAVSTGSYSGITPDVLISLLVTQDLGLIADPASLALVKTRMLATPGSIRGTYAFDQPTEDCLTDICDTLGLEWKVVDGIWIVTTLGNAATASPVSYILSAQTGLLGWSRQDSGIIAESLANPNVAPGSAITILDSFNVPVGSAQHRVETVGFTGVTDGDSLMNLTARASTLLGGVL